MNEGLKAAVFEAIRIFASVLVFFLSWQGLALLAGDASSDDRVTFFIVGAVCGVIICQNNFRHSFSLTWSGKTCDIRRSL